MIVQRDMGGEDMLTLHGDEEVESGGQDDEEEQRIARVPVPDAGHGERSERKNALLSLVSHFKLIRAHPITR
jgi:hypothetical protein